MAGSLLPVVLFAVAVVYQLSKQEKATSERRALLAARNLAETVEREIASTSRTLQALATSEQLDRGDLKSFYNQALRVVQTQPTWLTAILLSPNGRQLANTKKPFGMPLPSAIERESLVRVAMTRQPTVGNLTPGEQGNLAFAVRVPAIRNGNLRYILTAVITPKALASVVEEQSPVDGEWTRTVVDARGIVVARTRNPDRFVGKRGTASFLKRIAESSEGVYRDRTLEGERVYVAYSRIENLGWTVAVTVPVAVIQSPSQKAMWVAIGSGLTLLLISGTGAIVLARQISRSITLSAAAAEALAKGERPQIAPSPIEEIALLGKSLEFSANLLLQRERQLAENLAQAEAAREEAEAANRIKDEFLAVLSHELRTPLNPILGWSKLLRSGRLDAAKTAYALETIERNAKLQTQLIEDLLDVSRILRGKLNLNMAPVDLGWTINAALETVRLAAQAKSIQIQVSLDSTTGKVLGDSGRLQQVVWNLVSNAVKFTPEKGRVEVRLQQVEEDKSDRKNASSSSLSLHSYAQITVSDTGKGISPEFLPHVFEYFRQADSSTTRIFGGLGLGLAIVRHLVELHGGTVRADSPGEGQGATFTVELPLIENSELAEEKSELLDYSSLSIADCPLAKLRVLLVDDEEDARDVVAFILRQAGAIVITAQSAIEALEVFSRSSVNVVVSDIGMAKMDGYMLIRQIRTMPPEQGGQVPAIALTAYAGEIDQQQAIAAGFQRHIPKPVEPEELVKAIVNLKGLGTGG
ncbi:hybrid sensor histidine kinase/response regulator [Aerosakkonema funiforme]|uniref:Circadian input-output histidine kinase CikA n=1 Tax=Aerosakkonema funiforme FACHB-1375 TaxID=2949571 RepID=A0A926ZLC1_9CYAN|nr:hybrid sensor histidine kinase/response regulator [Aerosakkonema funiforme]MBD2186247.1 response regulator [Aerosakkonema funiforme FACHB-1375]